MATFLALAFASCSDDGSEMPSDNVQNLLRTEKFSPSLDAYQSNVENSTKRIVYYQENEVIADSTFDPTGNLLQWQIHEYTNSMHVTTYRATDLFGERKIAEVFDAEGRLTEIHWTTLNSASPLNPQLHYSITYHSDGSITNELVDLDGIYDSFPVTTMYTNVEGFIYKMEIGNTHTLITWDGNKPVSSKHFNGVEYFPDQVNTFYTVPKPANMHKSITELTNDMIFNGYEDQDFPDHVNHYALNSAGTLNYERTFNALNYQTYCKATGRLNGDLPFDSETFFYYE